MRLILSDWKRPGHLNNISNEIIRLLRSELLRIWLLLSVFRLRIWNSSPKIQIFVTFNQKSEDF
jgi:hypothetical protein